jgi:hypothetical protein
MRPALATVLSPRPWEARLVEAAADTGLVRLVGRCYNPSELSPADVIAVGSEVPWLSAGAIRRWRARGAIVIGVFPVGDRPAIEMFCRAGVDQLFADLVDPIVILRAIRDLAAKPRPDNGTGRWPRP